MSRWNTTVLAPVLLALAALAAYANSFSVPLLFDDRASILENPTIRTLWPITRPLAPPNDFGLTVSGRPIVNLSLALNYAVSGTRVWSYHALNLCIHVLAGLALYGLSRHTLSRVPTGRGSNATPTLVAFLLALVWLLHPLNTESVTYIIQRAEALMGLFYLLTLYAFARAVSSEEQHPQAWSVAAVVSCAVGMACKEVMVTAPVIVLLYDRTFVTHSFRAAWRARRRFYVALASTWLLLAWLVIDTGGNRGGTMGFDLGTNWSTYWLAQFEAITRYVQLALWPHPLVFEYGRVGNPAFMAWFPSLLFVGTLIGATAVASRRWPAAGFLGAVFFGVLAPTSLIPGQLQAIVEHRTYLPLAALLALIAVGVSRWRPRAILPAALTVALLCGLLTSRRNRDYRDEIALWTDTIAHRPANDVAHVNLGMALLDAGRTGEAITHFETAVRLRPDSAVALANLANAHLRQGAFVQARTAAESAVRCDPNHINARVNLGLAWLALDQPAAAVPEFETALRLQPRAADVEVHLATALHALGKNPEAAAHYRAALELDPADAETWFDFGNLHASARAFVDAIACYRRAIAIDPAYIAARNNLANALLIRGEIDAAIEQYEIVMRARPDDSSVRENLESAKTLRASQRGGR